MENKLIIKHPLTGNNNLQVALIDFQNQMNFHDACKSCMELGPGWRLPSIEELEAIYKTLHLNKLNFNKNRYWSNTQVDDSKTWVINFYDGKKEKDGHYSKNETLNYVRAVRITEMI
jgi:hypothetical protein